MQVRILFTMPAGLGRRIVAAASAALALLASPAHAEPAMWVVMEATNNGDMAMMGPLIIKHGYDLTRPLSSKLNGDDWARVQSAAKTAGLPISTVERMRPWLAALALGLKPVAKEESYDCAQGVDRSLEARARSTKARERLRDAGSADDLRQDGLPEERCGSNARRMDGRRTFRS